MNVFERSAVNSIATRTGFLQRTSKLTPSLFLDLIFYGVQSGVKSLEQMVKHAWDEHSLSISKQSLDERFTPRSVDFVKVLIAESLAAQLDQRTDQASLQLFSSVKIKDSTIIEIDESLSELFEGFGKGGGPNSKAGMAIQYEFDIKTNRVCDIDLKPAVQRDAKDAIAKKGEINQGELIIRDLGYYSDAMVECMIRKKAYFLSKLYPKVSVRLNEGDKGKVSFDELYRSMAARDTFRLDMDVFIGKKKRPARMIVVLLPPDVYARRIRIKVSEGKRNGYSMSEEYRALAHFNIYICNIPRDAMSAESVCNLYHIRWQIELVFKSWKSIMKIDELRKMRKERFLTTIYGKLLWIFIHWKFFSECRNEYYAATNRILSVLKCFNTLKERGYTFRTLLYMPMKKANMGLMNLVEKLGRKHWLEKRKNRLNLEEIFPLIFCISKH